MKMHVILNIKHLKLQPHELSFLNFQKNVSLNIINPKNHRNLRSKKHKPHTVRFRRQPKLNFYAGEIVQDATHALENPFQNMPLCRQRGKFVLRRLARCGF